MVQVINLTIDKILSGWKSACTYKDPEGEIIDEVSVGRIAQWGAHYICVIHEDVPEDERKTIAEFIANAPDRIEKLRKQTEREGKLILKMKDEISKLKQAVNKSRQKESKMKHYNDDREKSMTEPEYFKNKKFKFIHVFVAVAILFTIAVMNSHAAEKDYQIPWCKSQHGLWLAPATTIRDQYTDKVEGWVDCLTVTHAIEVDFDKKWKEAFTQSLWYARNTGKRAGILLIITYNNKGVQHSGEKKLRDLINGGGYPIDIWIVKK